METVEARRCIIAAPITAYKSGAAGGIAFKPPLPRLKEVGDMERDSCVQQAEFLNAMHIIQHIHDLA